MRGRRRHTVKQLVTAVRAFHVGLIADTEHQLATLRRLAETVDALRTQASTLEKRQAIKTSWRQLKTLRAPWLSTYRDLERSLLRLYVGLDGRPDDLRPRRKRDADSTAMRGPSSQRRMDPY